MKFYGTGVVWDAEKGKPLMRFDKNGIYETNDKRITEILQNVKSVRCDDEVVFEIESSDMVETSCEEEYTYTPEELEEAERNCKITMNAPETYVENMNIRQLKAHCKDKGYTGYSNLSKPDILAFIDEREG